MKTKTLELEVLEKLKSKGKTAGRDLRVSLSVKMHDVSFYMMLSKMEDRGLLKKEKGTREVSGVLLPVHFFSITSLGADTLERKL